MIDVKVFVLACFLCVGFLSSLSTAEIAAPAQCSYYAPLPPQTSSVMRYVSPQGSNSADGTSADKAWLTLTHAVSKLTAGMTVNVASGTYAERVNFDGVSGTATNWIVFQAASGASPVIDLHAVKATNTAAVTFQNSASFIYFAGFEVCNYKTSSASVTPIGISFATQTHHITVVHNSVHNIETSAGTNGNAHGIAAYGTSGTTSINNIIVSSNTIYDCVLGNSETLAMNGNVEFFEISDNYIYNNDNIGIDVIGFEGTASANDQARYGLVTRNIVYSITSAKNPAYGGSLGADGIYVDGGKDTIISNNVVAYCDLGIEVASEHAKPAAASNITVESNVIIQSNLAGLSFGGYDAQRGLSENCVAQSNVFYLNNESIWLQYYCQDITFDSNTIVTASTGTRSYFSAQHPTTASNIVMNSDQYVGGGSWDWINSKTYNSLSTFKTGSGQESLGTEVSATVTSSTNFCLYLPCSGSSLTFVDGCPSSSATTPAASASTTTSKASSGSSSSSTTTKSNSNTVTSTSSKATTSGGSSSSSSGCFAARSQVRVLQANGQVESRQLSDLQVGELVESVDESLQSVVFSEVYAVLHAGSTAQIDVIEINTSGGAVLQLTAHHLLFAQTGSDTLAKLVPARSLAIGDRVLVAQQDGTLLPQQVVEVAHGKEPIRAPLVVNDRIIVDGVASSVFSVTEKYSILTWPLKAAFRLAPSFLRSPLVQSVISAVVQVTDILEARLPIAAATSQMMSSAAGSIATLERT